MFTLKIMVVKEIINDLVKHLQWGFLKIVKALTVNFFGKEELHQTCLTGS